tara:strand:- start:3133 stop:4893 length:1761 start_codon:yes stop_codon:yes gene_type:complete
LGTNLKILKINIRYFSQLFLSYVLLILVAIGGLSIVTVSFVKQYVERQTIQNLTRQLTYINHILLHSDQPHILDQVLKDIYTGQGYDFRLTMIAKNGTVFFDSSKAVYLMDNHNNRPEVIDAKQHGIGASIRYSQTLNKKLVYVAKKAENGDFHRLALPINYLQDELGRIRQKIVLYTMTIFGFCLLFTFLMSHWISAPLTGAINTLNDIKNRNFKRIQFKRSSVKEINNLNLSLVEVSDNISQFIGEISREKEKKDIILNNMINGLIVVDQHLDIRLLNKAAFQLFFDLSETNQTLHLSDFPIIFTFANEIMKNADVDPIEIEHNNGKTILISGSIYSDAEEPQGILIAQDITKLKRLESTRQKFVANVSHELKTPITIIRSMFETILASKEKEIDIPVDLLQKGMRNTDRLNQIIDELLQLSKLETTGGEIEKERTNLNAICENVFQQCLPKANEKNIKLISENNDQVLLCNSNLLIQALKNLVENAIKYSSDNTIITIAHVLKTNENKVVIHVIDQGPGIEEKHIHRLFQRFYRIDNARSRQMGGTGLGLAIVKHISQSHGGQAYVESIIGKGSTFTIEIPYA